MQCAIKFKFGISHLCKRLNDEILANVLCEHFIFMNGICLCESYLALFSCVKLCNGNILFVVNSTC